MMYPWSKSWSAARLISTLCVPVGVAFFELFCTERIERSTQDEEQVGGQSGRLNAAVRAEWRSRGQSGRVQRRRHVRQSDSTQSIPIGIAIWDEVACSIDGALHRNRRRRRYVVLHPVLQVAERAPHEGTHIGRILPRSVERRDVDDRSREVRDAGEFGT